MEADDLMLLMDHDIEYKALSDKILQKLSLGDELFVATSALGELLRRRSSLTNSIAQEILFQSKGDKYLQAMALEALFKLDKNQAFKYLEQKVETCDGYLINSIMEIMLENKEEFQSKQHFPFVQMVQNQLQRFSSLDKYPEVDVRNNFIESFPNG